MDWYPQKTVCYASAVRDMRLRRVRKKHEKNEPGTKKLHPLDGVSVWVARDDLQPDETFFD